MRLIDADDFRRTLNIQRSYAMESIKWVLDGVIEDLDEQPTAYSVKHGHWVKEYRYSDVIGARICEEVCSCCGCNTGKPYAKEIYDYCYKCGANMDEEVEQ